MILYLRCWKCTRELRIASSWDRVKCVCGHILGVKRATPPPLAAG